MDKLKGAFLTMEKFDNRELNSVGSSRIRARWLLPFWPECEEFIIGKDYHFHIYQKVYWDKMMDEFKGIKILDLCDPDWLEGKPVFEYIDKADAVVTSTESLAEYVRKLRPNVLVKCIPDRMLMSEMFPRKEKHEGKLKKLVWFGYNHNTHYLYSAFDEIISRELELTIISNQAFEPPLSYRDRIKINNVPYSYSTVNKEIVKCDAVLMPEPSGDEKSKYKSNNKTLIAKALRMPVVRVPADLDRFESSESREVEAELGLKEIEEKWTIDKSVKEYKELIAEIEGKKQWGSGKKRVG